MIHLALLQTDSSHAEVYQDLATPESGVRIANLWGVDPVHTAAIARQGVRVCAELEEAIAGVDGIMICGRWGDGHRPVAEAALQARIPVYVDKPFTNSAADAEYLLDLYRNAGVPIFSASPLRFAAEVEEAAAAFADADLLGGNVTGLGQWPDFGPKGRAVYFYGIHAMELVTALFGTGIEAV
nr:Gfo/Idh/MocA family oxidoreductase [Alphaproteobacteria bacterium]